MRLLADENFPLPTIEALRQAGHDVAWARTDVPGAKDTALLDAAEQEGRILLTLDKDFWQVAVQRRRPLERGGVILFRAPGDPAEHHALGPANDRRPGGMVGHAAVVTVDRVLMFRPKGRG